MKIKKVTMGRRIFVLDGYNVIHAVPELKAQLKVSLQAARRALLSFCSNYRMRRGDVEKVMVVFDGQGGSRNWMEEETWPGVEVVYSDSGEKADDRILQILEDLPAGSAVVVSNDNFVSNHGRALAARVIPAAYFYEGALPAKSNSQNSRPFLDSPLARQITEEYKRHLGIK